VLRRRRGSRWARGYTSKWLLKSRDEITELYWRLLYNKNCIV